MKEYTRQEAYLHGYTDYPFTLLGDKAGKQAPIRPVVVIGYDGDKYCKVVVSTQDHPVGRIKDSIKSGYIYQNYARLGEGALGDIHKYRP